MGFQHLDRHGIWRIATSLLLSGAMAGPLAAQEGAGVTASPTVATETAETETYWTPELLSQATPPALPTPAETGPQDLPQGFELVTPKVTEQVWAGDGADGALPSVEIGDALERPIAFDDTPFEDDGRGAATEAHSSFGAYFTTTRVIPSTAPRAYPFRTAGKLFFRDPRRNTNHVCSAAVLRPRLVATAGHCVTRPSTNASNRYFFTNFLFVPAYDNGVAPYGRWTSSQQWVSNDWHHSTGSVPNKGDIAILVMRDQAINGATRKIGNVTGWLGWRTNALSKNHLTMLGYPCNIDSCRKMQMTNAGVFAAGGQNTWIYGSAGRGGHSGGPWIQDFGVAGAGAPTNTLAKNYLVGITSYGPTATEPKYLGASNLGSNFTSLINSACGASSGNC